MSLYGDFYWQHHDLCLFHQAIYEQLSSRERDLADFEARHRQALDSDAKDEAEAVHQSRLRTAARVQQIEIDRIMRNGDQLLIAGLWAMIEQYSARTLAAAETIALGGTKSGKSYKWADLKSRFLALNIDLTACENHQGANECRVLNNKIKHLGIVDAQLAKFARFAAFAGKPIHEVTLEMQVYSDAAYEFIGSMMESTADTLV